MSENQEERTTPEHTPPPKDKARIIEPQIDSISPPIKADLVMIKVTGETFRFVGVSEDSLNVTSQTPIYENSEKQEVAKIRPVIVMDLDKRGLFSMD